MTYEIWGTYNGTIETLEQELELDEAQRLAYEYQTAWTLCYEYMTAFGNDWTIEVMEINPTFGTAQGIEW